MSAIKAIFFDIGNVLVRVRTEAFMASMAELCDDRWNPAAIRAVSGEPRGPHIDYEKGLLSGEQFHGVWVERFGLRADYPTWLKIWNNYFEPNRPMEALLARLKGQARFFTLSNTNAEHIAHLKLNFRLFDGFEAVVASNEVGARKPEAAIFSAALQRAGVLPGEVLYLDDIDKFVAAGRALGMHGFHYTFNDENLRQYLRELGFQLPPLDGRSANASC